MTNIEFTVYGRPAPQGSKRLYPSHNVPMSDPL